MKRFLLTLLIIFCFGIHAQAANIVPDAVSLNNSINTFGVYQVDHSIVVYSEPDEKSKIKQKIVWSKEHVIPQNLTLADLFIVYLEDKDLALMSVTDETDDWVEVIFNNKTGETGWIKKDDPYKFNTWVNFYSMYGRKYGLYILHGAPENVNYLHGAPEDTSKMISTINKPKIINLNVIRGNWMLVTVVDADRTPKTGYIRWRNDDGAKYVFPKLK